MANELLDKIKKESGIIFVLFIVLTVILKIVFYNEPFISTVRISFSIFWIFILPGFYLLYYWHNSLDFLQRFVLSTALSIAVIGTLSYHLGLIGLHIRTHTLIIPLAMLIIAFIIIWRVSRKAAAQIIIV